MINVNSTIEVIWNMRQELEKQVRELKRIEEVIKEKGDISYASEAIIAMTSCLSNLRLDLLVTRPIHEYEKELRQYNNPGAL